MEHKNYQELLLREKPMPDFIKKMKLDNSFNMCKTALNKPPKEYLGWSNDPENPEYQRFHKMGMKLVEKALKGELPNQKKYKVPEECYKEFGNDLDGCSRQELQGCSGCKCLIRKDAK